ncbi:MAG: hypothetical protein WKF83_00185 [Nocardioidaceae bacterium]
MANPAQFEGYTNGDHKAMIDTMMSTGDIGRIADGCAVRGGSRRRHGRLRR